MAQFVKDWLKYQVLMPALVCIVLREFVAGVSAYRLVFPTSGLSGLLAVGADLFGHTQYAPALWHACRDVSPISLRQAISFALAGTTGVLPRNLKYL